MGIRIKRGAIPVGVMFLLLLSASALAAQSEASSDNSQIANLLTGLSNHSVRPSDVLDPSLSPEKRESNLAYFDDPSYQLSFVAVGPVQINADGSAAAPVRVQFKNRNTEMSAQSTVEFVKRNQVWYFADFSFVGFPGVIVALIIIGALIAVSYTSGVLLLRRRLLRQGRLDWGNRVKIFIPVFWPALFSKS
jgi:hypothetical protein